MRDSFRLDERIWRDRAIELMRAMNSEILRLVEHERVVGNKEKTRGRTFRWVINTRIAPAINTSDAFGHDRERNFLVGIHRSTQSRKIDDDTIACLRLKRGWISRCWLCRIGPLRGGSGPCTVHTQPSR